MTRQLRDALGSLVSDEPPMTLAVDDLVMGGRRRRRSRNGALVAATLAVATVGVWALGARSDTVPPPNVGTSATATASAQPSGSLLSDPGFEASPLTWDKFGAATVVTGTSETVHGGRQAARVVTTSANPVTAGVTSRPVLVVTQTGARYTASCWVRATASVLVYAQVQEYTPGWVKVTDPVKSPKVTTDDPERWYQISVSYTATTTGNLLPLSVFGNAMTAAGAVLFIDDCALESP